MSKKARSGERAMVWMQRPGAGDANGGNGAAADHAGHRDDDAGSRDDDARSHASNAGTSRNRGADGRPRDDDGDRSVAPNGKFRTAATIADDGCAVVTSAGTSDGIRACVATTVACDRRDAR